MRCEMNRRPTMRPELSLTSTPSPRVPSLSGTEANNESTVMLCCSRISSVRESFTMCRYSGCRHVSPSFCIRRNSERSLSFCNCCDSFRAISILNMCRDDEQEESDENSTAISPDGTYVRKDSSLYSIFGLPSRVSCCRALLHVFSWGTRRTECLSWLGWWRDAAVSEYNCSPAQDSLGFLSLSRRTAFVHRHTAATTRLSGNPTKLLHKLKRQCCYLRQLLYFTVKPSTHDSLQGGLCCESTACCGNLFFYQPRSGVIYRRPTCRILPKVQVGLCAKVRNRSTSKHHIREFIR